MLLPIASATKAAAQVKREAASPRAPEVRRTTGAYRTHVLPPAAVAPVRRKTEPMKQVTKMVTDLAKKALDVPALNVPAAAVELPQQKLSDSNADSNAGEVEEILEPGRERLAPANVSEPDDAQVAEVAVAAEVVVEEVSEEDAAVEVSEVIADKAADVSMEPEPQVGPDATIPEESEELDESETMDELEDLDRATPRTFVPARPAMRESKAPRRKPEPPSEPPRAVEASHAPEEESVWPLEVQEEGEPEPACEVQPEPEREPRPPSRPEQTALPPLLPEPAAPPPPLRTGGAPSPPRPTHIRVGKREPSAEPGSPPLKSIQSFTGPSVAAPPRVKRKEPRVAVN